MLITVVCVHAYAGDADVAGPSINQASIVPTVAGGAAPRAAITSALGGDLLQGKPMSELIAAIKRAARDPVSALEAPCQAEECCTRTAFLQYREATYTNSKFNA